MPELPDVEVFKRYFDVTALHKKVTDVDVKTTTVLSNISATRLKEELINKTFRSSRRHGKYIFVNLLKKKWCYMHFGMTGELKYYKKRDDEPKYGQVIFALANHYFLAYLSKRKLGAISVIDGPDRFIAKKELGPDALEVDFNKFKETVGKSTAAVKSGLMNQNLIAGIGNIYSDEMIFQARIHPKKKMNSLNKKEVKKLFRKMRSVLKTAIERKADPDELPRSYLLPHRDKKEKCPRCGGNVTKIKVSGRTGYFCPRCQKK
jgi:formamidopyrimidine-DNA glycosylase